MKKINTILTVVALFYITILEAQIADRILKNGKVYIGNNSFAQSIAIKEGHIIYTGPDSGINAHIGPETLVNDLAGKLVLPGLHDVHMHPLEASSSAGGNCQLDNSETDAEKFIPVLQACNLPTNTNGWKLAAGHDIGALLDASRDPKLILDQISTTVPILVLEGTSHSIWVNSKALEIAGITASTPDPIGGYIVKNAAGQPNGILLDNAGDNLVQIALAKNTTLNANNYNGLVDFGLPLIAKNGITSISEARTYYKRDYIETWKKIKADGLLTCRVGLAPWLYPNDDDATQIAAITALYENGDDLLKIRQIKCYSDGIVTSATAALSEPYTDNLGFPFNKGLNYLTEARLANYITQLERLGYDFHIHAIGDRGISESLNAIQTAKNANPSLNSRHRITHLEIVNPADYPRFKSQNVTADIQVAGDFTQPGSWHDNDGLIGMSRASILIPLKSLFDAGARITLSSDWDVSGINPFVGMQNALTRTPQNLPNVEEAVKAYTINSAYVMRQETVTGSLELGKYADLIVVNQDIFTVPVTDIGKTVVNLTLLGGKEVYTDKTLATNNFKIEENEFSIKVYPTVATQFTTVRIVEPENRLFLVEIYDLQGKLVQTSKFEHKGGISENKINLSSLTKGVYLIKTSCSENSKSVTKKVIVNRS